jgi:hypothetical protein
MVIVRKPTGIGFPGKKKGGGSIENKFILFFQAIWKAPSASDSGPSTGGFIHA